MGYVVVHPDPVTDKRHREYRLIVSRLLLNSKIGLDCVPRIPVPGLVAGWRYVSADEAEARQLAEELRRHSEDPMWQVAHTDEEPTLGPLAPISVRVGLSWSGLGFDIDPISTAALRLRYEGAAKIDSIWLKGGPPGAAYSNAELGELVDQLLPLLTNLSRAQLARFGGFEVYNTAEEVVRVPFHSLLIRTEAGNGASGPSHSGTAASHDYCTAESVS